MRSSGRSCAPGYTSTPYSQPTIWELVTQRHYVSSLRYADFPNLRQICHNNRNFKESQIFHASLRFPRYDTSGVEMTLR